MDLDLMQQQLRALIDILLMRTIHPAGAIAVIDGVVAAVVEVLINIPTNPTIIAITVIIFEFVTCAWKSQVLL